MMIKPIRLMVACLLVTVASTTTCFALDMTREQASRALAGTDVPARRAAAARLGEIGRMADVAALVKALRDGDEEIRRSAEAAIWEIWGHSGDVKIDELYIRGLELLSYGATVEAIKTFTVIVQKKPDFAEGWNKRATAYYAIGEFEKSLRDCDEVLKRNPLHFGALAGYGLIYTQLNQPERALDYFKRALKINPNMHGVAQNIELIEQQGKAKRRNYI